MIEIIEKINSIPLEYYEEGIEIYKYGKNITSSEAIDIIMHILAANNIRIKITSQTSEIYDGVLRINHEFMITFNGQSISNSDYDFNRSWKSCKDIIDERNKLRAVLKCIFHKQFSRYDALHYTLYSMIDKEPPKEKSSIESFTVDMGNFCCSWKKDLHIKDLLEIIKCTKGGHIYDLAKDLVNLVDS